MRCGSFAECTYRRPRSAASRSTYSRASSKSRPTSWTSAPKARIAAFFSGLLPIGTATVHGTLSAWHAIAIDWP